MSTKWRIEGLGSIASYIVFSNLGVGSKLIWGGGGGGGGGG